MRLLGKMHHTKRVIDCSEIIPLNKRIFMWDMDKCQLKSRADGLHHVRFGLAFPGSATAMGMADGRGNAFGHLAVGSRGTITTASQMRKRRRSKPQTTIMLDNQTSMIFVSWSCFGKTGVNSVDL